MPARATAPPCSRPPRSNGRRSTPGGVCRNSAWPTATGSSEARPAAPHARHRCPGSPRPTPGSAAAASPGCRSCPPSSRNAMTSSISLGRQLQVRHEPPVTLFVVELRRIRQEGPQVRRAALVGDLGQVGSVVGALTQQRVAVDAVLPVPHVLARDHLGCYLSRVRQGPDALVRVDREREEDEGEQCRGAKEEDARLSFCHG